MSDENPTDESAKPFWQSRTIIGAAVALVALFAGFRNVKIDTANLTDILVQVAGLVGTALAIWGRFQATRPIKFLGATTPGGVFNSKAEIKKAGAITTRPDSSQSGKVSTDTLLLVAALFILLGVYCWGIPAKASQHPLIDQPDPEVIAHRSVCEWIQIVTVQDNRPFLIRLLASIRCTPSAALVTTASGTSPQITKIEISGGADF